MIMQTERLVLRAWRESDAGELFRYASDPDVGPIAGWPPHRSAEESLQVIREVFSSPQVFAICLKEKDAPVGCISLKLNGQTDMTEKDDECELGYWLGKPFWGRGLMPEAVREMLRHAFEDLKMQKVWAGYYEGNERSRRVQLRCGFRYQWTTMGVEVPLMHEERTGHVSVMTRERWEWVRMWELARAVQKPRAVSKYVEAGGVAAAVMSVSGKIYTGVCVDTCSTLGICAERSALFAMLTQGENEIRKVLAVMSDGKAGPPCGACRELMVQLMPETYRNVEVLMDFDEDRTVTLGELTPQWWI